MKERLASLHRLKRWIGQERARYVRFYNESLSSYGKERAYAEINVCDLISRRVDHEVKRLPTRGKEMRTRTIGDTTEHLDADGNVCIRSVRYGGEPDPEAVIAELREALHTAECLLADYAKVWKEGMSVMPSEKRTLKVLEQLQSLRLCCKEQETK